MSGQINIPKKTSFSPPPTGSLGYGFDSQNNPVRINADGSFTKIPIGTEESGGLTVNVIANRGVGLLANLPLDPVQGDIYVTTDSFEIYTRIDAVSWQVEGLIKGQFVTDSSLPAKRLYQYDGAILVFLTEQVGLVQQIDFDPRDPIPSYLIARMFYDEAENTWTFYNDIPGISLQLGEELRARLVNDIGGDLLNGKAVAVIGGIGASLQVELLDTSIKNSSIRGYGLMTHTVVNGQPGYAVSYGAVRSLNTLGIPVGSLIYGDPETPGDWINVQPAAPNYSVRIGMVLIEDETEGVIVVDTLAFNGTDTGVNIEGTLNGMVSQTPDIQFSESGGIIYADVINEYYPTKKLPLLIGGVRYLLDTLTGSGPGGAARIIVPPGASTTSKQKSWIYITLNGGVPELGVSTTKPTVQNAAICTVIVYNAARTVTDGKVFGYRRENNASDSKSEGVLGSYGFTRVLADDARSRGSAWDSGQDPTSTVNDTTIQLALSAGIGKQLHYSGVPLFDGLLYQVYNDDANQVTYEDETNLINILLDANGNTLLGNGFYYTFRFYYKLNSNGIGNDIVVTRPQGHYSTGTLAEADALKYTTILADTDIEDIVYPLFDMVVGRTGGGGTTVAQYSLTSLRSKVPGVAGGSGGEGTTTDDKLRISAADLINDYLNPKVTVTAPLVKTIVNPGANEQLNLSIDSGSAKLLFVLNVHESITGGQASQKIPFSQDVGTIDYEANLTAYDTINGDFVFIRRDLVAGKETDGINVYIEQNCTVEGTIVLN